MIFYFNILYKARDWGWGDSFYNSNCAQNWMYYEQYGKHQYDISRVHQLALRFGEAFICFTEFIVLAHQGVVTPNLFVKCGCKGLTT